MIDVSPFLPLPLNTNKSSKKEKEQTTFCHGHRQRHHPPESQGMGEERNKLGNKFHLKTKISCQYGPGDNPALFKSSLKQQLCKREGLTSGEVTPGAEDMNFICSFPHPTSLEKKSGNSVRMFQLHVPVKAREGG